MKVLFLNGPPRCGKDTVGEMLSLFSSTVRVVKFAHLLKVATHALFAALQDRLPFTCAERPDPDAYGKILASGYYESSKDRPHADFMGQTPREAYIAVSEMLCKPFLGPHIFGHLLAARMQRQDRPDTVWVVTDCGFAEELRPILNLYDPDKCVLVRITRQGCTFAGDSRRYIDPHEVGLRMMTLDNSGELHQLRDKVRQLSIFTL
jgi:hypothetical protein